MLREVDSGEQGCRLAHFHLLDQPTEGEPLSWSKSGADYQLQVSNCTICSPLSSAGCCMP